MRLTDVPRNDVPAALRFLAELGRRPTPEEAQVLMMLQSDPKALLAAVKRVLADA